MDVRQILREWLEAHDYQGLCTEDCGCNLDDLAPCGQCGCMYCNPGHARDGGIFAPAVPVEDVVADEPTIWELGDQLAALSQEIQRRLKEINHGS